MRTPSLFYKGKFIAHVGFRNKDAFVLINDSVSKNHHGVIIDAFYKLIKKADDIAALNREKSRASQDKITAVFGKERDDWGRFTCTFMPYWLTKRVLKFYLPERDFVFVEASGKKSFQLMVRSDSGTPEIEVLRLADNLDSNVNSRILPQSSLSRVLQEAVKRFAEEELKFSDVKSELCAKVLEREPLPVPQDVLRTLRERVNMNNPYKMRKNPLGSVLSRTGHTAEGIKVEIGDVLIAHLNFHNPENSTEHVRIKGAQPGEMVNLLMDCHLKLSGLDLATLQENGPQDWTKGLEEQLEQAETGYEI